MTKKMEEENLERSNFEDTEDDQEQENLELKQIQKDIDKLIDKTKKQQPSELQKEKPVKDTSSKKRQRRMWGPPRNETKPKLLQ